MRPAITLRQSDSKMAWGPSTFFCPQACTPIARNKPSMIPKSLAFTFQLSEGYLSSEEIELNQE